MPTEGLATLVRVWATWLFFVSSIVAVLVSGVFVGQMPGIDAARQSSVPTSLLTESVLAHLGDLQTAGWFLIAAAVAGAVAASRYAPNRDVRLHVVSLIALVAYHLTLLLWLTVTIALFVIPAVRASI